MTTTLTLLLADVRDHLDEATANQWTDAMLTRWINEGLKDIARRAEVIQDRATIPALVGVQEYTLPVDMHRVYRVEYQRTGDNQKYSLEYKDFNNLDAVWWTSQGITEGTPMYFTMWGMPPAAKVVIYPKPSSAGSFTVFYYRQPATLVSGGDVAEIPSGWESLVVLYCEYMALRRDADPRWQEAKSLYESGYNDLYELTRRWSDQAGSVEVAGGGMVPGWLYGGSDW